MGRSCRSAALHATRYCRTVASPKHTTYCSAGGACDWEMKVSTRAARRTRSTHYWMHECLQSGSTQFGSWYLLCTQRGFPHSIYDGITVSLLRVAHDIRTCSSGCKRAR